MDTLFNPDESPADSERERRAAIACFLSHGEGWRDAKGALGGAFAGPAPAMPGLRREKEK